MRSLALAIALAVPLVGACHPAAIATSTQAEQAPPPPLPPSSGTPIGYLLDSATDLKLSDTQVGKLKELDDSLSAVDADIDAQLRMIEKPEKDEETPRGEKPKRHVYTPGVGMTTTADAGKLHSQRSRNDQAALVKAFAVLDDHQQVVARRMLEDHGVTAPGSKAKQEAGSDEDGTPLPGEP